MAARATTRRKTASKPAAKRSKSTAGKTTKAPAKKTPAKKTAAKKPAQRVDSNAPRPVKTGRGAGPGEVGRAVVEMLRAGAGDDAIWAKWFSPSLVSIEGHGQAWHGIRAVRAKCQWWSSQYRVHDLQIEGPFIGATGFAVRYTMQTEEVATGNRAPHSEVGIYTVRNGKVVQEEFMYAPEPA